MKNLDEVVIAPFFARRPVSPAGVFGTFKRARRPFNRALFCQIS